jgi:hypothetical protein
MKSPGSKRTVRSALERLTESRQMMPPAPGIARMAVSPERRESSTRKGRVVGQGPPKDGAGAKRVEFETEAVFFAVRIPLDQMKFLKCAEETVDGGLVQTESGGELSERHVRTVFSQVKQNADGLLQRFAGSCAARLPGQGAFTMGGHGRLSRHVLGWRV